MTMLYENIRLALFSLKANKMRALLTMLGIIIGIGSVIAIMTVGDSVTSTVTESMSSMGVNNITVTVQERKEEEEGAFGLIWSQDEDAKKPKEDDYITSDMLRELQEAYPQDISAFSISQSVGSGEMEQHGKTADVNVSGTSLGYFLANDTKLAAGAFFSEKELQEGAMVALISEKAVDDMFQGDDEAAVGQYVTVSVDKKYYNLIIEGVYQESDDPSAGMYAYMLNGNSTSLYIPLKTAQNILHTTGYSNLTVVVDPEANPDQCAEKIETFFANRYRNNPDFEVKAQSLSAMVSITEKMMNTITTAIALIGGIALVVGGIGVMNIMLVSITERTREIGTRKALGAPNSSIRTQFIIESIVICVIGGAIGIVLGCVGGVAAANFIGASAVPSVKSILISLGFSMAIGVFFGYYPANKAAKLNPIDALRYE